MLAIDAERLVRDPFLEVLRSIGVDLLVAQRAGRLLEEEIEPAEQAVQFVARLADRLADLVRQRAGERFVHCDDALAERRNRGKPLADRHLHPFPLAGAGKLVLAANGGGVVGGDFRDHRAVGGIRDLHAGSVGLQRVRGGLVRSRGGEKFVEDRRVIHERGVVRRMELGVPLHGEHVCRDPDDGSPRRCGPAPTTLRRRGRGRGPSAPGDGSNSS